MNSKRMLAHKRKCTGCLACVDSCKHQALTVKESFDGHLYPLIDKSKCNKCGLCSLTCPIINKFEFKRHQTPKVYVAWSNVEELRKKSTSGGIFAALAKYVIDTGGVVFGAAFDGILVKHIEVSSIAELAKIQGSKYQESDASGSYRKCYVNLKKGVTVLFSGTPCQIGGLLSFLKNKKYKGKLLTCDFICTGLPSILPLRAALGEDCSDIKLLCYRDKTNGWGMTERGFGFDSNQSLRYIGNKGKLGVISNKNMPYITFSNYITHRDSCLNCNFAHFSRVSDITLADSWGDTRFKSEHYWGISSIIIHNNEIEDILCKIDVSFHESNISDLLSINKRMVFGDIIYMRYSLIHLIYPAVFRYSKSKDFILKCLMLKKSDRYSLFSFIKIIEHSLRRVFYPIYIKRLNAQVLKNINKYR